MAQASVRWWRLVKQCQRYVSDFISFNGLALRRLRQEKRSVIGLALLIFLFWNWQLVLAIAIGLGSAVTVFMVQQQRWRLTVPLWQRLWNPTNRGLTLAIATGGLSCLSLYMVLQVWAEADSFWLAISLTVAQFGLLGIAGALALHVANQTTEPAESRFDAMLTTLTQPDALKRLIAIRQATRWVLTSEVKASAIQTGRSPHLISKRQMRNELVDCFRVMLSRETDPILCRALVDGLDTLNATRRLAPGNAALALPKTQHQELTR